MTKHPIENYNETLKELARDIVNLRYDALEDLLLELSKCLLEDADKDESKNRIKLASLLQSASRNIMSATMDIAQAWRLSKKFTKENK